jgi:L,D-peptidoglycan transpeptidase YkuD (ErfK/YbiS/YcfS/YnhG family)
MRLLGGYFRPDGVVGIASAAPLRLAPITPSLGWCDAPNDRNYNRPVPLPYPAGHERMMRADRLYDVCLVLDWNVRPRRRGMGSAIFLHIARPGLKPTEGCIAVTPSVMRRLLPLLRRGGVVRVTG